MVIRRHAEIICAKLCKICFFGSCSYERSGISLANHLVNPRLNSGLLFLFRHQRSQQQMKSPSLLLSLKSVAAALASSLALGDRFAVNSLCWWWNWWRNWRHLGRSKESSRFFQGERGKSKMVDGMMISNMWKSHVKWWYPLVNIQIAIENDHLVRGFTHWKWWIFPSFFVCLPGRVKWWNSTFQHVICGRSMYLPKPKPCNLDPPGSIVYDSMGEKIPWFWSSFSCQNLLLLYHYHIIIYTKLIIILGLKIIGPDNPTC